MCSYAAASARRGEHVGRLLTYLRQSGAIDNTTVIITADHGEAHGDHDLFGHGLGVQ